MNDERPDPTQSVQRVSQHDRVVYVMPSDCLVVPEASSGGVRRALRTIWQRRLGVIVLTSLGALGGVTYALLATEWFRADVVLAAAEKKSVPDFLGSLGGLASLAGVTIGGGGSDEPIAVLKSREFTRAFIEDNKLLTTLLARKWNPQTKQWKGDPGDWPDVRDAIDYFERNVRTVSVDKKTGIVTLSIRWTDPTTAAAWANQLVQRLNEKMRQRALLESTRNITFLRDELASNSTVSLQQPMARVLEAEMQRLMLARGNAEFAFRVIDPATPPRKRSEPKRAQVCIITTALAFALAIVLALALPARPQERPTGQQ